MTRPAAGFVRADKPPGVTSHDVVAAYRRTLGVKAGHAGTLDPFATGLLIVLLGSATRLQRYVLGLPKTYVATARLGWRSTTGDPDGELTRTGNLPSSLVLPTGTITQRVPMTSAVRVDGERLYRKARRGEQVERPTREVTVHRATLLSVEGEEARYEIECSSGTYVRTLIEELGDAYCVSLRRTAIGSIRLPRSGSSEPQAGAGANAPNVPTSWSSRREALAEAAAEAEVEAPEGLLGHLPALSLDRSRARLLGNGVRVEAPDGAPEGPLRLLDGDRLLGVGRLSDGLLRTDVVLPSD